MYVSAFFPWLLRTWISCGINTVSACLFSYPSVCVEFNIRDKIVRTTTDSGSNFVKAFGVYGVTEDENNNAEPLGAEPDQSGECYTLVCDDDIAIV